MNIFRHEKVWLSCLFAFVTITHFGHAWLKWKSIETCYADCEWDDNNKAAFKDVIHTHSAVLCTVHDKVSMCTIYDVASYYGHWKKVCMGPVCYELT